MSGWGLIALAITIYAVSGLATYGTTEELPSGGVLQLAKFFLFNTRIYTFSWLPSPLDWMATFIVGMVLIVGLLRAARDVLGIIRG